MSNSSQSIAEEMRAFRARIEKRLHDEHGTVDDRDGTIRGPGGSILFHLDSLIRNTEEEGL